MRLREELELYPTGHRFLSHGEIRKRFGANQRVIMAALEILREEGVLELRERIGSFSRLSLRNRRPLILYFVPDYPSSFSTDSLAAFRELEARTGAFRLLLRPYDYQNNDFTGCSPEAADAVILNGNTLGWGEQEYRWVLTCRRPLLFYGSEFENGSISCLVQSEYKNGILAAQHFVERGHRRLAVIRSLPHLQVSRTRISSFLLAAASANATVEVLDCHAENGEYARECAREILNFRLDNGPGNFTGLLIDAGDAAAGVLPVLREHGLRVPDDIGCVVIDNLMQFSKSEPPLTAVGVDFAELAECVVLHLLDRIHGRSAPAVLELTPRLFDRNSVKKIEEFCKQ